MNNNIEVYVVRIQNIWRVHLELVTLGALCIYNTLSQTHYEHVWKSFENIHMYSIMYNVIVYTFCIFPSAYYYTLIVYPSINFI